MKKIYYLMPVALFLMISACVFRPVGKCTYEKNDPVAGKVTIISIKKMHYGENLFYEVQVRGSFDRDFMFSSETYRSCIKNKGLKNGSELKGYVQSGGPCPPLYWLEGCNR